MIDINRRRRGQQRIAAIDIVAEEAPRGAVQFKVPKHLPIEASQRPMADDGSESPPRGESRERLSILGDELRDAWVSQGVPAASLAQLSMGMSHDFQAAIEEGATMVRVGTAIFGKRTYPTTG